MTLREAAGALRLKITTGPGLTCGHGAGSSRTTVADECMCGDVSNCTDVTAELDALRAALAQPPERGEGPQRLGYRMGIVDARHAAAKATDWTDHMKRLDALISDSYAPGSPPPEPPTPTKESK